MIKPFLVIVSQFNSLMSKIESLEQPKVVLGRITRLTGIPADSLKRWHKGKSGPDALSTMKVWMLLKVTGYDVKEVSNSSAIQSLVFSALAFGVTTPAAIADKVKTATGSVTRWAMGERTPSAELSAMLNSLLAVYTSQIDQLSTLWASELAVAASDKSPQVVSRNFTGQVQKVNVPQEVSHKEVLNFFAAAVMSLVPLAHLILSDDFSPEERKEMREKTAMGQSHGVFELSNLLNRLCGEKARKSI